MSRTKGIFFIIALSLAVIGCKSTMSKPNSLFDLDTASIISKANVYLLNEPITISAFTANRSEGGKNDYFSEGPYWWPDPSNPNGPYIRRDGYRNPQNFNQHHNALNIFVEQVTILTSAYIVSARKRIFFEKTAIWVGYEMAQG